MQVSRQFVECLISASKFASEDNPILRHVSVRSVGGSHEICGTDGFALALYTIKEDSNLQINGYIDSKQIKFKNGYRIVNAQLENNVLKIESAKGRNTEYTYLSIVENGVTYPNYGQIVKLDSKYFNIKETQHGGKFLVYPEEMLKVVNSINTKNVQTVGLLPTEVAPFETVKSDGIKCVVYHDPSGERKSLQEIGTFNIETTTAEREVPLLESPQLFNPSTLQLIFSEASIMCGSYTNVYLNGAMNPMHIKGYSDKLFLSSEYLIMPIYLNT